MPYSGPARVFALAVAFGLAEKLFGERQAEAAGQRADQVVFDHGGKVIGTVFAFVG